jgi:hypothetical protein
MSTIVLRQIKGTPLTVAEVDTNFSNLNTDKLETTGGTISGNLTVSGTLSNTSVTALKLPVGLTTDRPGTPLIGHMRYNTTLNQFEGYSGSAWGSIGGGATGGVGDAVFFENSKTIAASYTISSGKNAMCTGPMTISGGATITVPSGSRWVVL